MEINREFLTKAKGNLEKQYNELTKERDKLNEQLIEVKGVLRWINQTLGLK